MPGILISKIKRSYILGRNFDRASRGSLNVSTMNSFFSSPILKIIVISCSSSTIITLCFFVCTEVWRVSILELFPALMLHHMHETSHDHLIKQLESHYFFLIA